MIHFCTYFDSGYLARGLALYRSLERHVPKFTLHILCFDDVAYDALARAQLASVKLARLIDLEVFDRELLAAKGRRSVAEYYFTMTSILPHFLFEAYRDIDAVTYIDADLFFFCDPAKVFEEMGDAAVAITPHRFTKQNQSHVKYGVYNVGWLTWRRDVRAYDCLRWYRSKSLEWCYDVVEDERYADQKYLDFWPSQFAGIHAIDHKGANLAPWNVGNYRISTAGGKIYVDDDPLIFYHFHGLKTGNDLESWRALIKFYLDPDAAEPQPKARFAALFDGLRGAVSRIRNRSSNSPKPFDIDVLMSAVYQPYLRALETAQAEIAALCLAPISPNRPLRYVDDPPLAATSAVWRTELDWKRVENQEESVWPLPPPLSTDRLNAIKVRPLSLRKAEFDGGRLARCARIELLVTHAASSLNTAPVIVDLSEGDDLIDHAFEILPQIVHREWVVVADPTIVDPLHHRLPALVGEDDAVSALSHSPDILLAGSCISRTFDWSALLHRLAGSAPWLILEMRTFSGTPTTLTTCRDVGASAPRPYWIVSHGDFCSALEGEALTIAREIVLSDPVRIPGVSELADHRLFLISGNMRERERDADRHYRHRVS